MSWVPKTHTWMKEYKKKKYAISCRQLNAPPTKEGSYQQANAWWLAKKAEVDAAGRPAADATTEQVVRYLEGRGIADLVEKIRIGRAAEGIHQLLQIFHMDAV